MQILSRAQENLTSFILTSTTNKRYIIFTFLIYSFYINLRPVSSAFIPQASASKSVLISAVKRNVSTDRPTWTVNRKLIWSGHLSQGIKIYYLLTFTSEIIDLIEFLLIIRLVKYISFVSSTAFKWLNCEPDVKTKALNLSNCHLGPNSSDTFRIL